MIKCGGVPLRLLKNTPPSAALLDSVPPDVKTTSSALEPMSAATCRRARSIAVRARTPAQCKLDGLPYGPSISSRIDAATSGARGVVALKSKYTRDMCTNGEVFRLE